MRGKGILSCAVLAVVLLLTSGSAHAMPQAINEAVLKDYTPAIWHHGLETAYEQVDPSKLRGFVVMERAGVPVERARHFITWSDYDYRGAVIHVDKGDRMTTRRGRPYAYLKRGDIMAIAGVKYFNRTVYLKLISADVYVPRGHQMDKRHSRVTVMLGFKFPKGVIKGDDANVVISEMKEWMMPFPNVEQARAYAAGIGDDKAYVAEEREEKKAPEPVAESQDEKMKSLEEKIDKARHELEEAEKELKGMKGKKK